MDEQAKMLKRMSTAATKLLKAYDKEVIGETKVGDDMFNILKDYKLWIKKINY